MEVLYPRCAGLDVHKDTVVAAVLRVPAALSRGPQFRDDHRRPARVDRLARGTRLQARRDGGDGLLEARLAPPQNVRAAALDMRA